MKGLPPSEYLAVAVDYVEGQPQALSLTLVRLQQEADRPIKVNSDP